MFGRSGVPFFLTTNGYSSCHHESGTLARSSPTISATYRGPHVLAEGQPAVFEVTIGNTHAFFESGQRTGIDRPGWEERDSQFTPPTMTLWCDAAGMTDGLHIEVQNE